MSGEPSRALEAPSRELEVLHQELEALRRARDELQRDLAELRVEVASIEAEGGDPVRVRIADGRRRRGLASMAVGIVLVTAGAIAITYVRHVVPERLTGRVRTVRGALPVEAGAPCAITTDWLVGVHNADLRVECGGLRLYGSEWSGAARCTISDAHQALSCLDDRRIADDGDPRVALERAEGRLVVDDARWSVEIALDERAATR